MGNIHVKLCEIWTSGSGDVVKTFLIWSSGCQFVMRNHLCNFVEGIKRNNSVKLF